MNCECACEKCGFLLNFTVEGKMNWSAELSNEMLARCVYFNGTIAVDYMVSEFCPHLKAHGNKIAAKFETSKPTDGPESESKP